MKYAPLLFSFLFLSCKNKPQAIHVETSHSKQIEIQPATVADSLSWKFFLQHVPQTKGTVLAYNGRTVPAQEKAFAVLAYDVGTRDLQQCADALMRLRAEYLFAQKRFGEISFHFTGGQAYAYTTYLQGKMPVPSGNDVRFVQLAARPNNATSLRRYLNLVYTYAGTISLAAELKEADDFTIGTIVIKPGSPGHCFIITDEAATTGGEKIYKLVEGYTPAQTMYVLRNISEPALGCWHRLKKGTAIETASYAFSRYQLKAFE